MLKRKSDRVRHWEHRSSSDGAELEGQFIMRIPKDLADSVHEAIDEGTVQDRLTIKLEQDLRKGQVRLDDQLLYAKLVDLPTVVESYKTIDNKSFYKSADISQILLCKEDPDDEPEVELPIRTKKRAPYKVDKKYLYPHGITPPCKNVRKRRFRKTLKKKNVEAPEIEKEVKHLLRMDSEAIRVDYEIVNAEDDSDLSDTHSDDDSLDEATMRASVEKIERALMENSTNLSSDDEEASNFPTLRAGTKRVAAHDIFGGELSSTDTEDEADRGSATYSRMFDFFGASGSPKMEQKGLNKKPSSPNLSSFFDSSVLSKFQNMEFMNEPQPEYTQEQVQEKIIELQQQISDLKAQQSQKSAEIASIQNATLKKRLEKALENLYTQGIERELELKDFENMLD